MKKKQITDQITGGCLTGEGKLTSDRRKIAGGKETAEAVWKGKAKKVGWILLGNVIYAAAVAFFVLPHEMITGGTTDLALIAWKFFDIPVTLFISVFNVIMFLLGLWMLGREFAVTTLISTFCYPVILQGMQLAAGRIGVLTEDIMLSTVFAGTLVGIGLGLVIREGASTGGIDIPPLIIHKHTGISVSLLLTGFDLAILMTRMVFSDYEQILYGILMVCIYNLVMEQVLVTGKRQVQVSIVSDRYEEINRWITVELDRGSTLVRAEGGYLRRETMEVVTVVSKREVFRINEKVKEIDPDAFMVIGQVNEVRGRGFTKRRLYRSADEKEVSGD